jgi:dolichyl-phosphate beta-glucosyltransferase
METEPQLSLIVPCFNEERRLPASLARIEEYLEGTGYSYEVLLIDDGSADRTAEVARETAARNERFQVHRYEENRGKGFAVAYGGRLARGRWVLFSDADLSTPLYELEKLIPYLERGYDVVIGSRALKDSELKIRQPWWRERAGRVMNLLIRRASGLRFKDTQCGFKLFSRQAARDIFPNLTVRRWMFDVEALILARKLGYDVADVPITWINSGESRVKLSHTPNIFRELLHIRLHWLRRQPERFTANEAEDAVTHQRR